MDQNMDPDGDAAGHLVSCDQCSDPCPRHLEAGSEIQDVTTGLRNAAVNDETAADETAADETAADETAADETAALIAALPREYQLSDWDQSVARKYTRRMFIFDFPQTTEAQATQAIAAVQRGVEVLFRHYPFLAGKIGLARNTPRNLLQLRYCDTAEHLKARPDIFQVRFHSASSLGSNYEELCRKGMPVSHWDPKLFCASPPQTADGNLPGGWNPVFTLQMNFLEAGGLVLCLAAHQSVADGYSFFQLAKTFAAGVRGDIMPDDVGEFVDSQLVKQIHELAPALYPLAEFRGENIWNWHFDSTDDDSSVPNQLSCPYILTMSADKVTALKCKLREVYEAKGRTLPHPDQVDPDYLDYDSDACIAGLLWMFITRARVKLGGRNCGRNGSSMTIPMDFRRLLAKDPRILYRDHIWGHLGNFWGPTIVDPLYTERFLEANSGQEKWKLIQLLTALIQIEHPGYNPGFSGMFPGSSNFWLAHMGKLCQLRDPLDALAALDRYYEPWDCGIVFRSHKNYGADINFGIPGTGGTAAWYREPWVTDICGITVLPRAGGDKGQANWEIVVCVPRQVMSTMMEQTELGQFVEQCVNDQDPSQVLQRPDTVFDSL